MAVTYYPEINVIREEKLTDRDPELYYRITGEGITKMQVLTASN